MIWKGAYLWNQVMLFTLSQIVDGSLLGHRRIFFFLKSIGWAGLKDGSLLIDPRDSRGRRREPTSASSTFSDLPLESMLGVVLPPTQ